MADKSVTDLEKELLALFDQQREAGGNPMCVLSRAVLEKTYGIGGSKWLPRRTT